MKERASHSLARCSKLGISALEKGVAGLYPPFCEEDGQQKARDVSAPSKPFAAFGSFRQRHGDVLDTNHMRTIEAPAKLESAACVPRGAPCQAFSIHHNEGSGCLGNAMEPVDCDRVATPQMFKPSHPHRKPYCRGKSFSTDLDREEAWERKKEQYLLEEEDDDSDGGEDNDADDFLYDELCEKEPADESSCGSDDGGTLHEDGKDNGNKIAEHEDSNLHGVHVDVAHADEAHLYALPDDGIAKVNKRMPFCKRKPLPRRPAKPFTRTRTKSLTDEDMEELRGSIDLGFGFSYSERCNLKSTLPALELYYAINKNYVDVQSRSSPVSPLDGSALVRNNSTGSTSSPSSETWRISSPGDHPSQVKSRLRHWAQAVACSVKQGY